MFASMLDADGSNQIRSGSIADTDGALKLKLTKNIAGT